MESWRSGENQKVYEQFLAVQEHFSGDPLLNPLLGRMEEAFLASLHFRLQYVNAETLLVDEFPVGARVCVDAGGQKRGEVVAFIEAAGAEEDLFAVRLEADLSWRADLGVGAYVCPGGDPGSVSPGRIEGTEGDLFLVSSNLDPGAPTKRYAKELLFPVENLRSERLNIDPRPYREKVEGNPDKYTEEWYTQQENLWFARWYEGRISAPAKDEKAKEKWEQAVKRLQKKRFQVFKRNNEKTRRNLMRLHIRQEYLNLTRAEMLVRPLGTAQEYAQERDLLRTCTKALKLRPTALVPVLEELLKSFSETSGGVKSVVPKKVNWGLFDSAILGGVDKAHAESTILSLRVAEEAHKDYMSSLMGYLTGLRECEV